MHGTPGIHRQIEKSLDGKDDSPGLSVKFGSYDGVVVLDHIHTKQNLSSSGEGMQSKEF